MLYLAVSDTDPTMSCLQTPSAPSNGTFIAKNPATGMDL